MKTVCFDTYQWERMSITMAATVDGLRYLSFTTPDTLFTSVRHSLSEHPVHDPEHMRAYIHQLAAYLSGERKQFQLPLDIKGTEFQLKVWAFLLTIPYGKVASYQQVAEAVGRNNAFRATGMANHANPVSVVVPCHRIIGKTGHLTGYGGGVALKSRLLRLEGVKIESDHIVEKSAWM